MDKRSWMMVVKKEGKTLLKWLDPLELFPESIFKFKLHFFAVGLFC